MSLSAWWHGLRPGLALAPEVLQGSREEPAGLRRVPLPAQLTFPLHHPGGWTLTPAVGVGDRVRFGETLAVGPEGSALSLHAAAAGTVSEVDEHPVIDPVVERTRCIVIATRAEKDQPPWLTPITAPESAAPETLRARAGEAGLMGMGGAQFPTVTKLELAAAAGVHTLIVNGAECDPSLTCDQWLMQAYAAQIVRGAQLLLRACGAERCVLPLEDDKPAAVAAMEAAVADAADPRLEVIPVAPRYPAGGERQLIERLFAVEVPTETWPVHAGYVSFNVATAAAFDDAVRQGQPLTERIISIAGPGVAQPGNVIAPLGASIAHLIEHGAGGYREDASRLVVGGAMMGIAMADDDAPITPATNGLLVLTGTRTQEPSHRGALPCIRCGDCAAVCPARLQPQELFRHLDSGDLASASALHVVDCIECGSCDTVCPSQLPLTEAFRQAKRTIARTQQETQRADRWRASFERRNHRLATDDRADAARASRRAARTTAAAADAAAPTPPVVDHVPGRPDTRATEDERQAVIRASIERARQRRQRPRRDPDTDG
ncbi:MAG: electron transport complex subunit RsxC [Pseudomonadota bacterium]